MEGVNLNLMLPCGSFGPWTVGDVICRTYHRWMADYCGA
jgi:hypothetical protein